MDIGRDSGLPVDRSYESKGSFPFTGTIRKVTFDLKPHLHEDEQALHAMHHQMAAGRAMSA